MNNKEEEEEITHFMRVRMCLCVTVGAQDYGRKWIENNDKTKNRGMWWW